MVTRTPHSTTTVTFEIVISAWREKVACEITTRGGTQCRRPARWRVDVHGCERALMCTNHFQHWESRVVQELTRTRTTLCGLCARSFSSLSAVRTVTEL